MSNRKKWTKVDMYILSLTYSMGASTKLIARYFDSTPTAVNKRLSRSGIRPFGSVRCGVKVGSTRRAITYHQLDTAVHACKLDQASVSKRLTETGGTVDDFQPSDDTIKVLASFGAKTEFNWRETPKVDKRFCIPTSEYEVMKAREDSPIAKLPLDNLFNAQLMERKRLANSKSRVSFSVVWDFLNEQGVPIKRCSNGCVPSELKYIVNNKWLSDLGLLMLANKLRISMGLEPMLVDDITE